MQVRYTVAGCNVDEFSVEATVAGQTVQAKVPGLVVELVSEDGSMCHMLRVRPTDMAAAEKLFAVGNGVVATFKAG